MFRAVGDHVSMMLVFWGRRLEVYPFEDVFELRLGLVFVFGRFGRDVGGLRELRVGMEQSFGLLGISTVYLCNVYTFAYLGF